MVEERQCPTWSGATGSPALILCGCPLPNASPRLPFLRQRGLHAGGRRREGCWELRLINMPDV